MSFSSQSAVLVTGATGNVGRNVVLQLVELGIAVRALSRTPEKANLPSEVEVVAGDMSAPATFESSLANTEKAFLLCRRFSPEEIQSLVETLARHVNQIVFLSSSAIQENLPVQADVIGKIHLEVEQTIRQSGVQWTFLRPGSFAANTLSWWAPQLRKGNQVRWPYAQAAWAPIHERDIAAIAVRALTESGHAGKTYFPTGGQVLTQEEQLRAIGDTTGRTLVYEEIPPDDARKEMSASLPPYAVDRLLNTWARMVDAPAPVSSVVEEITGRPPATFRQWAVEHAAEFRITTGRVN